MGVGGQVLGWLPPASLPVDQLEPLDALEVLVLRPDFPDSAFEYRKSLLRFPLRYHGRAPSRRPKPPQSLPPQLPLRPYTQLPLRPYSPV